MAMTADIGKPFTWSQLQGLTCHTSFSQSQITADAARLPLYPEPKEDVMTIPTWLTILAWLVTGIGLLCAGAILVDIYLGGYRQSMKSWEAV